MEHGAAFVALALWLVFTCFVLIGEQQRGVVLRFGNYGRQVAREFFTPLGALHAEALQGFDDAELAACVRVLTVVTEALEGFDRELRRSPKAQP